jgi:hypothetical protein
MSLLAVMKNSCYIPLVTVLFKSEKKYDRLICTCPKCFQLRKSYAIVALPIMNSVNVVSSDTCDKDRKKRDDARSI